MLNEVVVVGYGTQKKVNMSGAVDAVSSKVLENRSLSNAGLGLQGAVPNLNITVTDGNANSSPKYNIRGIGSINSDSAEPLILVDNIPVTADEFSRMNANDIEKRICTERRFISSYLRCTCCIRRNSSHYQICKIGENQRSCQCLLLNT